MRSAFYLWLLALAFKAIFASSYSSTKSASLRSLESGGSKAKPVVGQLVGKSVQDTHTSKHDKSGTAVVATKKSNTAGLLIERLPKEIIRMVIEYFFDNDAYSRSYVVEWLADSMYSVVVDSARIHLATWFRGIESVYHFSSINQKEIYKPEWLDCEQLASSQDGRYVFFSYARTLERDDSQVKRSPAWLVQGNGPKGSGLFKPIMFDSKGLSHGILSRDGQTLFLYDEKAAYLTTHV